ncbi:hypothetical protein F2Q69_00023056 [Brassica cretica]|uniref:Uncharacterized protein n=1 Tax=Brassica cretica TaxID=69181 RepID=A0A8S9Q6T3_BRACR|nr:hypothetical protein F2Q69_00023056 [Brassica cretica]
MTVRLLSRFIRTGCVQCGKEKDACGAVRMVRQNVEMVRKDELWYGKFGPLVVVPAKAPFQTYAG